MTLIIYARQAMYKEQNTDARSRNHFCRGKARSITYSECVSVVLVVHHEKRMRSIILSCVTYPGCTVFTYIFSKTSRFSGKESY
jgi:hypothetical protein